MLTDRLGIHVLIGRLHGALLLGSLALAACDEDAARGAATDGGGRDASQVETGRDAGDAGAERAPRPDFPAAESSPLPLLFRAGDFVWKLDAESSAPEKLLDEPGYGPIELSPTAKHAVVGTERGLYLVHFATWDIEALGNARFDSFSPDGSHLLYAAGDDEYRLRAIEDASERVVTRTPEAVGFNWSPDSRALVVHESGSRSAAYLVDVVSGDERAITEHSGPAVFASDASRVAIISSEEPQRLTVYTLATDAVVEFTLADGAAVALAVFSEDASAIYLSYRFADWSMNAVMRFDLADGTIAKVADGVIVAAEARGRFAVVQREAEVSVLSLADGSSTGRLPATADASAAPLSGLAFAPNGERLAYANPLTVRVLATDEEQVLSGARASDLRWASDELIAWASFERSVDEGIPIGGQLFLSGADGVSEAQVGAREQPVYALRMLAVAPGGGALCEHRRIYASAYVGEDAPAPQELLLLWTAEGGDPLGRFLATELRGDSAGELPFECAFGAVD